MEKLAITKFCPLQNAICTCMFVFTFLNGYSQPSKTITIDECYALATANYPLIRQKEILSRIEELNLDNAGKGFLPQINVGAQASYQSDVTQLPVSIPGMEIPTLSRDQYKAWVDIYQPLTERKFITQQKQLIEAKAHIEEKKLDVDLYPLKERINQIYFGILLLKEQLTQVELLKKDITSGIAKVNAAIVHGTALKSSALILKAELLKSDQRTIELNATLDGYIQSLEHLIRQPLDRSTDFQTPASPMLINTVARPEVKWFEVQEQSFAVQREILTTRKIPKLGLFLQTGYGKPAFNLLKNKFDFYYIGGIRLNWALGSLYTSRNDRQLIDMNQSLVEIQKETFLFNTDLALDKQKAEITRYDSLITVDHQLISLYDSMLESYEAQLENGTITTRDYMTHINAVDVARQNLVLHETQRLATQFTYNATSGN